MEAKHLIVAQVYKWQRVNTKHIRVDWAGLLQALSLLDADAEKVVGFRRREPVHSSGKPRRNISAVQSGEFPISQSSGLPISQSKDGLIGNSRMDYQVISELPNREFHYIDLEITSETTSRDYSSPLTPSGELGEGYEQQKKNESDREASKPKPFDLQPQQPELLRLEAEPTNSSLLASHQERYLSSSEQADVYSWGKFSAAPAAEREQSSHQQPIQAAPREVDFDVAIETAPVSNNQRGDAKAGRCNRKSRTEPQLPKNIKAIACLGKPIIAASSTQSLRNGWREA